MVYEKVKSDDGRGEVEKVLGSLRNRYRATVRLFKDHRGASEAGSVRVQHLRHHLSIYARTRASEARRRERDLFLERDRERREAEAAERDRRKLDEERQVDRQRARLRAALERRERLSERVRAERVNKMVQPFLYR